MGVIYMILFTLLLHTYNFNIDILNLWKYIIAELYKNGELSSLPVSLPVSHRMFTKRQTDMIAQFLMKIVQKVHFSTLEEV